MKTSEQIMAELTEELKNYAPDSDKLKIWGDRWQMFTLEDIKKLIHCRPDPHAWYKRDLNRKRPHRKQGRNLYRGIQDYRRRVGQPVPSKKGLGFRGVARLYDRLRICVIGDHPEMAERLPDLCTRYMYLRFPPLEFRNKIMNDFVTPQKPSRGIDLSRYVIANDAWIRLPADKSLFVTPSIFTAGADAISRADPHDDAVMGMAMAMLRDFE